MGEHSGHIDVARSVDSITVGVRHRKDMGDLAPLIASIERIGLLQPITITPDGVLICGRRRLEAVKRLGWRTVRVWVRTGLSDVLARLLAQQDENTTHKPLSSIEAAALYRELKQAIAEDAARRQEATRFGADPHAGEDGAADSAAPPTRGRGDTRRQAAEQVTGSASYARLEQVGWLEAVANGEEHPSRIQDLAARELDRVNHGGAVDPSYQRVKSAIELLAEAKTRQQPAAPGTEELEALAAEALEHAKVDRARRAAENALKRASRERAPRPLRYFVLTWRDLDGWTRNYDPSEVGPNLSVDDWEVFERVVAETNTFAEAARRAREMELVGT